jgi:hypothetical protein
MHSNRSEMKWGCVKPPDTVLKRTIGFEKNMSQDRESEKDKRRVLGQTLDRKLEQANHNWTQWIHILSHIAALRSELSIGQSVKFSKGIDEAINHGETYSAASPSLFYSSKSCPGFFQKVGRAREKGTVKWNRFLDPDMWYEIWPHRKKSCRRRCWCCFIDISSFVLFFHTIPAMWFRTALDEAGLIIFMAGCHNLPDGESTQVEPERGGRASAEETDLAFGCFLLDPEPHDGRAVRSDPN